ncbi:methyltransferase domain-containing protein [Aurantimonas aggregata]|uniref:Protein-L-isoaspartate O-methyltransferase n=1 Tax=Aurantimonas aggregata TaxID=2047720 RepID=A0A6L9MP12_9HYPH|nr:methyltransferase domain-containing protein [Aurantimonas aggregata]NDV89465.1 methyltransferase domain-containing protein [Aurantimonas aggregata]
MTRIPRATLDEVRAFHAKMMAAASNSADERLERIFELVPREAFLGPGPWQIMVNRRYLETPSADPVYVYQNVLVALDAGKGINNGEPFLHASWIGAAGPKAGDTICHVGAGTGYYTALLSMLALPRGNVHAFEIQESLAQQARENLEPFEGVSVTHGDATALPLPACDLIYVNAGVVVPPVAWLKALKPGGRMIFPWQPAEGIGLAALVTSTESAFAVRPLMPAWFIPCVGASDANQCTRAPSIPEARAIRSLRLTSDQKPDETAVAIFPDMWFSTLDLSRKSGRPCGNSIGEHR